MQFRPFIQLLAPYLTAYLLLVSVGLPLQRVYCACVGEQWLTVIPEEHECHHDAVAETIHHHAENSCCHDETADHETTCSTHDCGSAEVLLAQLNVDFTADLDIDKISLGLEAILPAAAFQAWPLKPVVEANAPIRGPTAPAPPSGRQLLLEKESFLI